MRKILLNPNDYDLFHTELRPVDFEFFQSHKDTFRTMWIDQGHDFWCYFLRSFKCYHVEYGVIKTFPARSAEYGAILEEGFSYMATHVVEGSAVDAKTYIMDVAVLARNKSHVHHMESENRFSTKDPFFHKDTREVYRRLFGQPTVTKSRLKVYCLFDLLVMFAGSVVRCLKRWLEAPTNMHPEVPYWTEHDSMNTDLQIVCAPTGSEELELDFERYQQEMETTYLNHRSNTKDTLARRSPVIIDITSQCREIDAAKSVIPAVHKPETTGPDVKPKESGREVQKRKKKKRVKEKDDGFRELFSTPGVKQRVGVGNDSVTAQFKVADPYDFYPVKFTQRIKDMGKYKKVELRYEKETPQGTIKKAVYKDVEEFDEQDFQLYISELLHNPDKMMDVTDEDTNSDLPVVGKKIIQATQEQPMLEKEQPVFSRDVELRIAETLAGMDLKKVAKALEGNTQGVNSPDFKMPDIPDLSQSGLPEGLISVFRQVTQKVQQGQATSNAQHAQSESKPASRKQHMKAEMIDKLRNNNLAEESEREKEKVERMMAEFWRTEDRRKKEGDTSPDSLANLLAECDAKGLGTDEKEAITMKKMRQFVSEKFSEERKRVAEERKQNAKIQEKKPHPSGRDLSVEIPMLAKAFDVDLPPPPQLKKNKKGKLLKTKMRDEEIVRTLLSSDTSKYIEVTSFKEPGAPHSKFFIDIPENSCSEPMYRYCDPVKCRTITGPVRHELLIGLMHRHTMHLCPKDGQAEKEFLRVNPNWESSGILMLTDTEENDKRINNSVLYNKPMPDFDAKYVASTTVSKPAVPKGEKYASLLGSSTPGSGATASSGKERVISDKQSIKPSMPNKPEGRKVQSDKTLNSANGEQPRSRNEHELREGGNQSDDESNPRRCAYCDTLAPEPRAFKKCKRCKEEMVIEARHYCGKDCQVQDWKARHREEHRDNLMKTYQSCD